MKGIRLLTVLCLCLFSVNSYAVPKDLNASKDHPLVSRYPGSRIITYVAKDFDEYELPLSAPTSKSDSIFKNSKELEGQITRIGYIIDPITSSLKIFRNYENAFKKSGFKVLFSCKKESCGQPGKWQGFFVNSQVWGSKDSQRVMTVHKKIKGQDVYVVLLVGNQGRRITIGVDVIEVTEMENNLIDIDLNNLEKKLESEGKITLYGIKFEVDKANLLETSKKSINVLAEILLKNKIMQIYVVGHSDDSGSPEHNLSLSRKRAQSVVQELSEKYKIDKNRMSAFGAGPYAPVGNNADDDGRTLNRRVEIIKRL